MDLDEYVVIPDLRLRQVDDPAAGLALVSIDREGLHDPRRALVNRLAQLRTDIAGHLVGQHLVSTGLDAVEDLANHLGRIGLGIVGELRHVGIDQPHVNAHHLHATGPEFDAHRVCGVPHRRL